MCTLIIDADSLIYKACFSIERKAYDIVPADIYSKNISLFQDDYEDYKQYVVETFKYVKDYKKWLKDSNRTEVDFVRIDRPVIEPLSHALHIISSMMKEIIKTFKPEQCYIFLSGDNNFREEVAEIRPYKESRKDKPKPIYYADARKYLIDYWNAIVVDGWEADDACATLHMACQRDDDISILASIDKDLKMVPGWNYDYDKKILRNISWLEGQRWFYTQLLSGDDGDSIPGIPGMGERTAPKKMKDAKTVWEMYQIAVEEYNKFYGTDKKKTVKGKKVVDPTRERISYAVSNKILNEMAQLLWMRLNVGEKWVPPVEPVVAKVTTKMEIPETELVEIGDE